MEERRQTKTAALRRFLTRWRTEPWSLPRLNRDFTFACYVAPPAFGSAVSFIFHAGGIFSLAAALAGRRELPREPHFLALTAACWAVVLSYLLSGALNGLGEKGLMSILWLWTFFIFPFVYWDWRVADKQVLVRACIAGSTVASFLALALAIIQTGLLDMRPEGGAGNAIVFATVTSLSGLLALAGATRLSGWRSGLCFAATLAAFLAILLSETRGTLPGFVIGAIAVFYLRGHGSAKALGARSWLVVFAAGLLLLAVFSYWMAPRFSAAVVDLEAIADNQFNTSLGLRFVMLVEGARMAWEHPIFGFGPATSSALMVQRVEAIVGTPISYTHFHNAFLTILVETGLLGLLSLIALVVVPLLIAVRVLRESPLEEERFGALLLLLTVIVFAGAGLTSIMIGHDILDVVFVMSLALGSYLAAGRSGMIDRPEAKALSAA